MLGLVYVGKFLLTSNLLRRMFSFQNSFHDGTVRRGSRGWKVTHHGPCQSRPPARAVNWSVCMARETGALCVAVREPERQGNTTFMWALVPSLRTSVCGVPHSRRRKLLVWAKLSETRWRLLVRGGVSSCEAETPRARWRLLVRGGVSSCEAETCHARWRVVLRGRELSGKWKCI
jgi:hypothetical protein